MPLYPPPAGSTPTETVPMSVLDNSGTAGGVAFFGKTPVTTVRPGPFVQNYTAQDWTLPAYTPAVRSTAYPSGVLNLLAAATASDLNNLRVAYENLRVFTEALAKHHNALLADMKQLGLVG